MDIIASYNIKGGVGKTTTAVNLAYAAASEGYRVLLWDLDPQGASSYYFSLSLAKPVNAKKMLKSKFKNLIQATPYDNLDCLPADLSLRHFDIVLSDVKKSRKQIKKTLDDWRSSYDLLLLDCPPSISHLSDLIFFMSRVILVPIIPSVLSLQALNQLQTYLLGFDDISCRIYAFFSMLDKRKKLHRQIIEENGSRPGFCSTVIPSRSLIEQMGINLAPVGAFAPDTAEANLYLQLWNEIKLSV